MELSLAGQHALVTGASSGIGRAVARGLAAAGAAVAVNYHGGKDAAETLVHEIDRAGGHAILAGGDIASEAHVDAMFRRVVETFGTVDIVVANAGIQRDAAIQQLSLDDWNRVIGVNLTGQFLCARAAVREFRRRGPRSDVSCALGKIICMSSVHEVIPWAGHVNYAASKGGISLMMKSLAQELAPERIRVNAIAPGAIRTPINQTAWQTEAALKQLLTLIPYGRIGEPEDVANVAVWLASDASDYVTGTTLFVDGGMTLYPGFAGNG